VNVTAIQDLENRRAHTIECSGEMKTLWGLPLGFDPAARAIPRGPTIWRATLRERRLLLMESRPLPESLGILVALPTGTGPSCQGTRENKVATALLYRPKKLRPTGSASLEVRRRTRCCGPFSDPAANGLAANYLERPNRREFRLLH